MRLATSLLVEQNDDWLVQKRYLSLGSIALLTGDENGPYGPADADQPALPEGALAGVGSPPQIGTVILGIAASGAAVMVGVVAVAV
jgi:hypothetical protein